MGLTLIKNRQWAMYALSSLNPSYKCSAVTGFGLNEGMEWMANVMKEQA